jgi:ABC-type transport system involved in multi-copper enzyme maturation permease subunit
MLGTVRRLASAEILGWVQRRSLYLVVTGFAVLALISVAVGTQDLRSRRQDYLEQLSSIASEQVRPRLPMTGTAVERVMRVPRPPELGSVIARGEDVRLSPYFDFAPAGLLWGRSVVTDAAQMQAGALFDIESILRVIGGLIALLLGIDVVGTSRVRGQLRAWQALGLSPAVGVAGKLLGCAGLLIAGSGIVLGVVITSVGLRASDGILEVAPMVAASFVPVALYLCTFACIGAAVVLWSRTLVAASIAGVAIWVTVAMIGPQVSAVAGRLLAPVTPRAEFERARDQTHAQDTRAAEDALGDHLALALAGWTGRVPPTAIDAAVSEHKAGLETIWTSHVHVARDGARRAEDEWTGARNRQALIDRWLQYVTPGSCLIGATTALSGTGIDLSRAWYERGQAQQRQLEAVLFDDRPLGTIRYRGQLAELVRHRTLRWSDLPVPPPLVFRSRWREAAAPLAALVVHLGLACVAVAAGARRFDAAP